MKLGENAISPMWKKHQNLLSNNNDAQSITKYGFLVQPHANTEDVRWTDLFDSISAFMHFCDDECARVTRRASLDRAWGTPQGSVCLRTGRTSGAHPPFLTIPHPLHRPFPHIARPNCPGLSHVPIRATAAAVSDCPDAQPVASAEAAEQQQRLTTGVFSSTVAVQGGSPPQTRPRPPPPRVCGPGTQQRNRDSLGAPLAQPPKGKEG